MACEKCDRLTAIAAYIVRLTLDQLYGPFGVLARRPTFGVDSRNRGQAWCSTLNGQPTGELTLRTLAMPADANAAGDIFGGWVMAQMDLACGIRAAERAKGRVVTAAVKEMSFAKPMKIGDTLCIYTHVNRVGRTSMTLKVEAWAQRYLSDLMEKVTDADFVMVALDKDGKPKPVPRREVTGYLAQTRAAVALVVSAVAGSHVSDLGQLRVEARPRLVHPRDVVARPFAERIDRHQQVHGRDRSVHSRRAAGWSGKPCA